MQMRSQSAENGTQKSRAMPLVCAEKSIKKEIRDLARCEDVAAAKATIQRMAARHDENFARPALRAALLEATWKRPALLPLLVSALLPHADPKEPFDWATTALSLAMDRCRASSNPEWLAVNLETAKLIAAVSDGTAITHEARTALMLAAREVPALIETLLPLSNAKAFDIEYRTALMYAARKNDVDSVRLLLPHSDPNAKCRHGRPALFYSAEQVVYGECRDLRVLELLASAPDAPVEDTLRLLRSFERVDAHEIGGFALATDVLMAHPSISLRSAKAHVARHGSNGALFPKTRQRIAESEAAALGAAFDLARTRRNRSERQEALPEPSPRTARRL